jgi:opacity protein-like surface antigen
MKNTPLFLAAIAAVSCLPGLAHAQTYIGVSGGITLPNDSSNTGTFTADVPATATATAIPANTSLAWDTDFKSGYNISGQFGYRLDGGLRVEVEGFYQRNGINNHSNLAVGGAVIDGADVSVLTRGAPAAGNPTVGTVLNSGIGSVKSYGAFANMYYDLAPGGSFSPYVGGGIGLARNTVDFQPSNVNVGKGSDTNLAFQVGAGATYKISPSFELFGQYNYRDLGKSKFALTLLPADLEVKTKQSLFSLGVRVPLGGK